MSNVTERIAIVGRAVRLPGGGADLDAFWDAVAGARDLSRDIPAGRWAIAPEQCVQSGGPHPDKVYSARSYTLDPFTPDLTGLDVPADLVDRLDPLFHLVLDVGGRAWRSAELTGIDRRRVGVILGNICLPTDASNALAREYLAGEAKTTHPLNRYPAGLPAGLLAQALGLGGGTLTLDAACASSLYAIKLAADELLAKRADAMLAGGCGRPDALYTQMGFSQLRALSASGRCGPFDAAGDGLMVGEGAGIFVLKRLSDAVATGDTILAVLAGWGLSNDVAGSLLAPAAEGQLRAMRAAYQMAGWKPQDVGLIECHATGTPVGDAVEFDSLRQLWGETGWRPGQCAIGSVKSTVGHLLTGAGGAAVAKVLAAFEHDTKPPQANFAQPASGLKYDDGPFRVLTQAERWESPGRPRRAAVSGFGFGGVNAHLLLEEWADQVAALRPRPRSTITDASAPTPIAVVGLAAHVGPFETARQLQEATLGGASVPASGNVLDEVRVPLDRFRVPPTELEQMLPQQALLLTTAAVALDDCRGTSREALTGVFVGLGLDPNTTNFHLRWTGSGIDLPPLTADRVMGALGSIAASRVARAFKCGGPSFTVCSEESSAARAVELAVRALRADEIDRAIVGGVDLPGDVRSRLPSAELGRTGPVADGAAVVVLKRLADAERDGDRVYALIGGVGTASGGAAGKGPDSAAVASSLMRACGDGVIDPATIDYLDASTGPTEAEAVAALLMASPRSAPLALGDTAAQVGHAGFAAGAVALVKACLAVYQELLPATAAGPRDAAYTVVSDRCEFPSRPRYWLTNHTPRRAAVGVTGADGSSVHVVVEEYAKQAATDRTEPLAPPAEAVFAIEGDTTPELLDGLRRLAAWLPAEERGIDALAREWCRRVPSAPRAKRAVGLVPRSGAELREQIAFAEAHLAKDADSPLTPDPRPALRDRLFYAPFPLGRGGKLAVVFPGSGNQFAGMGRELGTWRPAVLRQQQAENLRLRDQFAPHLFWGDAIPPAATPMDMLFGQVTLGTLTADLLAALGVKVDALLGQSLGESAGLFGLRVWRNRDEMYGRIERSTLFASDLGPPYDAARKFYDIDAADWVTGVVPADADDIRPHLRPGLRAYLLIVATPTECVVGGLQQDVTKLMAAVNKPFVELTGVTLAHCEAGQPVAEAYRELHTLPTTPPPGLTVYSGAWGRAYNPTSANAAESITAGLVGPIDFPRAIEAAYRDGVRYFVEAGPGNSGTRAVAATLGSRPHLSRAMTAPRQDAVSLVLRLVAHLIAERGTTTLAALYANDPPVPSPAAKRELVLPTRPKVLVEEQPAVAIDPFVAAMVASQTGTATVHAAFLKVQDDIHRTAMQAVQLQMQLIARVGHSLRELPTTVTRGASGLHSVPRSLAFDQCMTYAVGKIGDVLGPTFAEVDAFPTRVRLPDGPLMLVDRILNIEGEPKSLTRGRVVTEHTVRPDRWYLDNGRCPTSITVESGQADLFLSGFLGIDFRTRGLAVYRLLDAVVTFHRGLPTVGERIEYDIRIDEFFNQGEAWLFRFRFEGTIDGQPLLSMQNGVAGFFTAAALAAGQGIVHTKLDRQPQSGKKPADWRELAASTSSTLSGEQVESLRRGDLSVFGRAFARLPLTRPMPLPGGMLRLVDRVPLLDPAGGRFGLGFVRAEYDIQPQEWFIECHFVDDKVMPGTLMYECCLHTLRTLLMSRGWVGEADEFVCEPVPGVNSRLKCRGQVLDTTKLVTYEVSVKEIGYRPEPYCVADALMYADGKPIVEITNLSLRMTGLTRERLEAIWRSPPVATGRLSPRPTRYDSASIRAYSNGKPSEAFGEPYRVFDQDRIIARLPGPPYQFLDRITAVSGEPFVLKAGASCTAEYAVPPGEWYFDADRSGRMPFSVLLEVALQPCGWLAAYCGSALTSDADLSFRNLGGQATQFRPVRPDAGTLIADATMTKVSQSAGMIIQHYDLRVRDAAGVVYEGTTYFGFFGKEQLRNQVGMPAAKVPYLTAPVDPTTLPADAPFPAPMMRMIDRIDGYLPDGGRAGLGLVQGRIAVDPGFWFFQAHFFQDPVWPGSLGLESFLQLLKYVAWKKGIHPAHGWQTVALNRPHEWTYRGQVLPTDREVVVVLEVTAEDMSAGTLTADGFLTVDGRVIYQMRDFTLE